LLLPVTLAEPLLQHFTSDPGPGSLYFSLMVGFSRASNTS
jgi:hypothetical protein